MFRLVAVLLLFANIAACTAPEPATPTTSVTPNVVPVPSQAPQTELSPQLLSHSDWAGAITHADGTTESIMVQFTDAGGTLAIQPHTRALTIGDVQRNGAALSFKVTGKSAMDFAGRFDGFQIAGEVKQSAQTNSFMLLPLFAETDDALAAFPGTYQFAAGNALLINRSPEFSQADLYFFGPGLMMTHFGTGAIRGLYPIANDTFLVGSGRAIGYPFAAQITFLRDDVGNVSGLRWQPRDTVTGKPGESQQAMRLALKPETVRYTSTDGITLTGLLTLPPTPGPHPAIVVLHGSERGTRNDFGRQQMSAFMASQGIAVLTYDKRGVGDSGGTYRESATESNLALLAQDAVAGVNYLKDRPEIDGNRIGLIGSSQAGWVIPLAAAQSDEVAFFVILSGPVVSVGHEDVYSNYTNDGEAPAQYSPEEISQRLARLSPSGFDPVPVITTLDRPGLWLWGDQDKSVPVPESVNNLKGLIAQGKANFTYLVFPGADHNLQQSTNGLFAEIPYSPGFPENYYTTLAQWLQRQVK